VGPLGSLADAAAAVADAFAGARMRVRDDEGPAVTRLPTPAAPGRADDPQLRDAARNDPFAVPFRLFAALSVGSSSRWRGEVHSAGVRRGRIARCGKCEDGAGKRRLPLAVLVTRTVSWLAGDGSLLGLSRLRRTSKIGGSDGRGTGRRRNL
jgi:hypothetical protein